MPQTLKMHRERRRLSTRELAKVAGVAADTIWRIEGGDFQHVRPATQRKLAAALNVDPDDIAEFAIEGAVLVRTGSQEDGYIAMVRMPAPTQAELAEYERRIERGNREGFYAADPVTGDPTDERVYTQVPTETPAA